MINVKVFFIFLLVTILSSCANEEKPKAVVSISDEIQTQNYESLVIESKFENWWETTVFYEIWPRSFYDFDGDGNGDFKGMTEKLPYLKKMGIGGIWLTPVFEAPSYHGYDFKNFYDVESDYGTLEDFEYFIKESHKHDIKVILDLVINHISSGHEWFQKSEAKVPGFEDYFIWRDDRPDGWGSAWSDEPDPARVWHWSEKRQAYYYAVFSASMPDLNLTHPTVVEEINRLASFWLEKGVDGFRLDAVRYAIEEGPYPGQADTKGTIDYWTQFATHVKSVKPNAMLVGEAWTDLKTVGTYSNSGKGLTACFDFEFGYAVLGILNPNAGQLADFGSTTDVPLKKNREDLWDNLKLRKKSDQIDFFSPFLTNHDQNRLMHSLEGDINKAKVAASLLATTPGAVFLYYGEEIGMSQFKTGDDVYRRAIIPWSEEATGGFNDTGKLWLDQKEWFPWISSYNAWWGDYWKHLQGSGGHSVAAQQADSDSLWHHYRALLAVRNNDVALQAPNEIRYFPVEDLNVWLVKNIHGSKSTITVINLSASEPSSFIVPKEIRGQYKDKLTGKTVNFTGTVTLDSGQTLIL